MNKLFYIISILLLPATLQAQKDWVYTANVNVGVDVSLAYGYGQKYPGFKAFAGFYIGGQYKNWLLANYGASIAVYTKSLGANLNPLVGDIQLDFINSFSLGLTTGQPLSYLKNFRTIGVASFYNIASRQPYGLITSTNLILNNHHRNQAVGSISITTPSVTINYYNDGAAPFNILPLGDNFDRWWTGGFGLYFHNQQSYNTVEFSFDQFTGYSPLLYELSGILGINIPVYDLEKDSAANRKLPPSFNTSAFNLKIAPFANYAANIGVIGNLKLRNGIPLGLQDVIHSLGHYPLHPNNDFNRVYIGTTINQFNTIHVNN